MKEVALERAKQIIIEPIKELPPLNWVSRATGRSESLMKFTRLIMDAEVYSINEIEQISKQSHDLVHLSGVHKFRSSPMKCDELRWFWTMLWDSKAIRQVKGLKQYIIDVCELSKVRAGNGTRPYGLFFTSGGSHRHANHPWRTDEWYAKHRPKKVPFVPVSEFYPFITGTPTEEHDLLLAVDRLVPKGLNSDTRSDICQDMIVAILSGSVDLENLKDATPKYVKEFFKMFPMKYGHLSLDMPLTYGGDTMDKTLGDTVAAEYR